MSNSLLMIKNFQSSNEVIVDWIDKKLHEVCRCINIFMNYLLFKRSGYKTFSRPQLHLPIVKYVIEELFNCNVIGNKSFVEVYPEDFAIKTRRLLRESSLYEIEIGPEIIEYIWKYISFGVSNLTEGLNFKTDIDRLKNTKKREYINSINKTITNMKNKILNGEVEDIKSVAIKAVSSYNRVKDLIKKDIESTNSHLEKFEKDPLYKDDNMGLFLSEEGKDVLKEFGVKKKRLRRLDSINSSFEKKNEELKKGVISYNVYNSDCKELLKLQEETLSSMKKDIKNSKVGEYMNSRKKQLNQRTGERELLDRIYAQSRTNANKWKRASLSSSLVETADYETRKPVVIKPLVEESDLWIKGNEDMSEKELKLTKEMIEKEYIDFNGKRAWTDFLSVVYSQLQEILEDIENDEESIKFVSNKITNKIKERIEVYQAYVSSRECDHNFDDEFDNCVLQSLIYLSISISDWLEVNKLGIDEFKTALQILLPESIQSYIDENNSEKDDKFMFSFIKNIQSYKLRVDGADSLGIIISTIKKVRSLKGDDKNFIAFNNRARYFANSLGPK